MCSDIGAALLIDDSQASLPVRDQLWGRVFDCLLARVEHGKPGATNRDGSLQTHMDSGKVVPVAAWEDGASEVLARHLTLGWAVKMQVVSFAGLRTEARVI